ncbi:two-component sensor histidine kinase [Ktedonobacter sp. SOSP1-52]|uniref:sensor histidine kinase n=1 Tax=Ktedonobacter sp. SOSP1-52 TaxID=2778366 RepID=UPI001915034F|nr:sensor histidine kinase [Ktedonobacter sp. SOSP1-52]GHO71616.1 two-component sensor histidine kinase [Ktedonobacter sp. SOSP1-52]
MINTQEVPHTETDKNTSVEKGLGPSPYLLWLIWVIWLPFFSPGIIGLYLAHPPLPILLISFLGVALFFTLYLRETLVNAQRLTEEVALTPGRHVWSWLPLVSMAALSFALPLVSHGDPSDWLDFFIFTASYVGGRFQTRQTTLILILLVLLNAGTGWLVHFSWTGIGRSIVFTIVVGYVVRAIVWSLTIRRELRQAREEIARLAVINERLRIARDLHDLLGHSLSLIALKSELAGRLLTMKPERAATEVRDIEQVARATLQEVRQAVTNYRQPTLASEIQGAQEILAAAGIVYNYEGDEKIIHTLPATIEAVLGWVIREGVTNIIKHSRAQHCTLSISQHPHELRLVLTNDGPAASSMTKGNGLHGITERVAALGGTCEAGAGLKGGFHLTVSVPTS